MGNKMLKIISKKYHPNLLVSINVSCGKLAAQLPIASYLKSTDLVTFRDEVIANL